MTATGTTPTGVTAKGPGTAPPVAPIDRGTWRLAWTIAFGAFASGLDTSLVNIALDTIGRQFHAGLALTAWVASGYLLALAVSLPACAWLGRRLGPGRLWLGALAGFTVASALCAAAPGIGVLIGLRVVQGLAAGLLVPAGQTVLGQAVGPGRLGRVMARLGVAVVLAPALGPVTGGLLLHALSWRWLFLVNVPVGAVALVLGWRWVPRAAGGAAGPFDWVGFGYLGAGLPLVVEGLAAWGSYGAPRPVPVLLPLLAGTAGLLAFVRHANRRERPLLDLRLYRDPGYLAASVAFVFNGVLTFGGALLFPLFFQLLHGTGGTGTGLRMLALGAGTALALPLGGRLSDRYGGGRVAVLGAGCVLVAAGTFAVAGPDPGPYPTQALLFLLGAGTALTGTPLTIAAFTTVPRDRLPDATAQVSILMRIGGALGAALFAVLLARAMPAGTGHAFRVAFAWQAGAAVAGLAAAVGLFLVSGRRRDSSGAGRTVGGSIDR
jgi:EmrB/QacA subfamily drug resistance transporter